MRILNNALLTLTIVAAMIFQSFVGSQASAASSSPSKTINLAVSEGQLLTLPGPAASVFIADPTIADVQVPQQNRIFIFGKKIGRTTLYALADSGHPLAVYAVQVRGPVDVAQGAVSAGVGGGDVKITGTDSNVLLQGTVPDPNTADKVVGTTSGYYPTKDSVDSSQLSVGGSAQVMLRVWIGEVSRTVTKDLAFNWEAGGAPGIGTALLATGRQVFTAGCSLFGPSGCARQSATFSSTDYGSIIAGLQNGKSGGYAVIDALASEGLVTTLAEPTLTALTGQSASFLAGGQFPIPFATGFGAVSVEFQTYGVSLNFVPTVLASNRINLKVAPEVSELSTQGEVESDGLTIPGLTVRRAQTTVELGSGESFAIAGLLQNTSSTTISKYPGLGDLPVIGALFRSNNFQRGETELIIIVTPYLVRPVDDPNKLQLPTDGFKPPSDIDRIFMGRMADPVAAPVGVGGQPSSISALTGPRLAGDAGFDLE